MTRSHSMRAGSSPGLARAAARNLRGSLGRNRKVPRKRRRRGVKVQIVLKSRIGILIGVERKN